MLSDKAKVFNRPYTGIMRIQKHDSMLTSILVTSHQHYICFLLAAPPENNNSQLVPLEDIYNGTRSIEIIPLGLPALGSVLGQSCPPPIRHIMDHHSQLSHRSSILIVFHRPIIELRCIVSQPVLLALTSVSRRVRDNSQ